MIELLEFTLLMRLFALFILVVFVLGWLEVLILIGQLYPEKLKLPVYIYSMQTEEPEAISDIDTSISDRIDITGTEYA